MARVTFRQQEIMYNYLSDNKDFRENKFTSSYTTLDFTNHWKNLASMLNADGQGPQKSVSAWQKTLSDWKCCTRQKNNKINTHMRGTGGGGPCKSILTELEVKLLNLLGIAAADGIKEVREAGFPSVSTPKVKETPIFVELPDFNEARKGDWDTINISADGKDEAQAALPTEDAAGASSYDNRHSLSVKFKQLEGTNTDHNLPGPSSVATPPDAGTSSRKRKPEEVAAGLEKSAKCITTSVENLTSRLCDNMQRLTQAVTNMTKVFSEKLDTLEHILLKLAKSKEPEVEYNYI